MTESKEDLSFAERIRANYKKAVARLDGDILTRFKAIIEDVSSRGASGLHVYYAASYRNAEAVSLFDDCPNYYGYPAKVYIDRAAVDFKQITEQLSKEGFNVESGFNSSIYAGWISWAEEKHEER